MSETHPEIWAPISALVVLFVLWYCHICLNAENEALDRQQRQRRRRPAPVIIGAGPAVMAPIPVPLPGPGPGPGFPPPPPPPAAGPAGPFGGGGGGGGDDGGGGGGGGGPPLAPGYPEPLGNLMGRAHYRPFGGGGGGEARYYRRGRSGSPFSNARSWSRVRPMPMSMYGQAHPGAWYAGPGGGREAMGMYMPWTERMLPRTGRGSYGGAGEGGRGSDEYDVIERGPAFP